MVLQAGGEFRGDKGVPILGLDKVEEDGGCQPEFDRDWEKTAWPSLRRFHADGLAHARERRGLAGARTRWRGARIRKDPNAFQADRVVALAMRNKRPFLRILAVDSASASLEWIHFWIFSTLLA